MFYSKTFSQAYRLGDIVSGYSEIIPIYTPNKHCSTLSLSISVNPNDFYVILTPCCSIEQKTVNIAPLKELDSKFLSSEKLIENFLLINQPITKRDAVGDSAFSRLPNQKKIEFENIPPTYEYLDKFIYDDNSILTEYTVIRKRDKEDTVTIKTGKYMVSFKDVMKIQCVLFERGKNHSAKVAELTSISREKLRDKLSFYYGRIPTED